MLNLFQHLILSGDSALRADWRRYFLSW